MADIQVQRKSVADDRTAEVGLEVPGLRGRLDRRRSILGYIERITCVHRSIPELEIQISVNFACAGFSDDFRAAVTDTTKFRAKWIVADPDFLNLVLRRNAPACKSVDHKSGVAACAAAGPGNIR